MKSKDSNSEKSLWYQKKDGHGHACPSFFGYDNDKDLKVCFLVTYIVCEAALLVYHWHVFTQLTVDYLSHTLWENFPVSTLSQAWQYRCDRYFAVFGKFSQGNRLVKQHHIATCRSNFWSFLVVTRKWRSLFHFVIISISGLDWCKCKCVLIQAEWLIAWWNSYPDWNSSKVLIRSRTENGLHNHIHECKVCFLRYAFPF